MGCDIHPFIEYDTEPYRKGDLCRTENFGKLLGYRDYLLFGLLTNGYVRISDAAGVAPSPKGLPEKISWRVEDDVFENVNDQYSSGEGLHYTSYESALKYTQRYGSEWVRRDGYDGPLVYAKGLDAYGGYPTPVKDQKKTYDWKITHPDWHSHSWLTASELQAVVDSYGEMGRKIWPAEDPYTVPAEVQAWLAVLRALDAHPNVIQSRLVFWFDN